MQKTGISMIVLVMLCVVNVYAAPPSTLPNGQTAEAYDPAFPAYPGVEGRCFDGVQSLGQHYSGLGFEVRYAYSSQGEIGHAWLLVDNEPIDYYLGRVDNSPASFWTNPEQTFDNIDEFKQHVIDSTIIKIPVSPGEHL